MLCATVPVGYGDFSAACAEQGPVEGSDDAVGLNLLNALAIALRSRHNRRIFVFFHGLPTLLHLVKGLALQLPELSEMLALSNAVQTPSVSFTTDDSAALLLNLPSSDPRPRLHFLLLCTAYAQLILATFADAELHAFAVRAASAGAEGAPGGTARAGSGSVAASADSSNAAPESAGTDLATFVFGRDIMASFSGGAHAASSSPAASSKGGGLGADAPPEDDSLAWEAAASKAISETDAFGDFVVLLRVLQGMLDGVGCPMATAAFAVAVPLLQILRIFLYLHPPNRHAFCVSGGLQLLVGLLQRTAK